ncbi:FAD-linked oxidoreductase-like protein [Talaromyces proteolyticus]|uniref:Proline dehydrogenase n=1 Tax=Talaromyces proteolyticus TaxID=1131652 RepID=A0AAD4KYT8_9EURO|nr:FAD-linked oxidoreductase-like protein [Talaromyces proteolyticus]KAH8700335.1 FAD-linked oxidoreductase-like protein [Talaromyces proteolyticus]
MRSLSVTTVTSVPLLLTPALASLSWVADSKLPVLDPDKNGALKSVLRQTIYSQFCAGESPAEVAHTISELKSLGYAGVILGYGREVVMTDDEARELAVRGEQEQELEDDADQVQQWTEGTMRTLELAHEGDFVALKFTGAGREALRCLLHGLPPSARLDRAIMDICDRARDRKVQLLFDAEQDAVQAAIDAWVLRLQRKYNHSFSLQGRPRALIYNTYQAYRLSTPHTLASHLRTAQEEGFVLGVKLVRGAYIASDPRHLFWKTKDETDSTYDAIAASLITRRYGAILGDSQPARTEMFPQADLVLATHNRRSIERARALRNEQVRTGNPMIEMVYGQLQGMADDISCQLVRESIALKAHRHTLEEIPQPYKYLVWGTVGECTKYLLRRGRENKDAASRTRDTRNAMFNELRRRSSFGLF